MDSENLRAILLLGLLIGSSSYFCWLIVAKLMGCYYQSKIRRLTDRLTELRFETLGASQRCEYAERMAAELRLERSKR